MTVVDKSLALQSQKIMEYRHRRTPLQNRLSGVDITVLANVYTGGADSEVICETMDLRPGDRVLDLCTGNGIIGLYVALHGAASVLGTDLNPEAIANARLNARNLGLANIKFVETDLFPPPGPQFDVITINPPYTDHPSPDNVAICFWDEGNSVTKRFFQELPRYLAPGAAAYIAWSDFADPTLLHDLTRKYGYKMESAGAKPGRSGFKYYAYKLTLPS